MNSISHFLRIPEFLTENNNIIHLTMNSSGILCSSFLLQTLGNVVTGSSPCDCWSTDIKVNLFNMFKFSSIWYESHFTSVYFCSAKSQLMSSQGILQKISSYISHTYVPLGLSYQLVQSHLSFKSVKKVSAKPNRLQRVIDLQHSLHLNKDLVIVDNCLHCVVDFPTVKVKV